MQTDMNGNILTVTESKPVEITLTINGAQSTATIKPNEIYCIENCKLVYKEHIAFDMKD